jgi:hypothetical protein
MAKVPPHTDRRAAHNAVTRLSGDSASADAERRRLLAEWAADVLTTIGVAGAIKQAESIAELDTVTFSLNDVQVILAIHDALFPAIDEPAEHFRRFTKKQLGAILRNQFDELKRYRRIALERTPSSASAARAFDSPGHNPAGVVTGILAMYLALEPHILVIFALWVILTHVYVRFGIAPRVALVSETPDAGKTTAWKIARHLVFRPNPEASATGAAIGQFFNEGPGTLDVGGEGPEAGTASVELRTRGRLANCLRHRREEDAGQHLRADDRRRLRSRVPDPVAGLAHVHARDGGVR